MQELITRFGAIAERIKEVANTAAESFKDYRDFLVSITTNPKEYIASLPQKNLDLALSFIKTGKLQDAKIRLFIAKNLFPQTKVEASDLLSWVYLLQGNFKGAIEAGNVGLISYLQDYQNLDKIPDNIVKYYNNLVQEYHTLRYMIEDEDIGETICEQVIQEIDATKPIKVLEMGAGGIVAPILREMMHDESHFTCIDINASRVQIIKEVNSQERVYAKVELVDDYTGALDKMLTSNLKYDLIMLLDCICPEKNITQYVARIKEILADFGIICIMLPYSQESGIYPTLNQYRYSQETLKEQIEQAGLEWKTLQILTLEEIEYISIIVHEK